MTSVPDFFQDESEDALRSQVTWLEEHLGLGDAFFSKLLGEDQNVVAGWRRASAPLARDKANILCDWWQTVLHLLSFQNFDEKKVRALLELTPPARSQTGSAVFSPAWCTSLKEHLETNGLTAIHEVDRWVESFRFGDPYAQSRKEAPCLSTRP